MSSNNSARENENLLSSSSSSSSSSVNNLTLQFVSSFASFSQSFPFPLLTEEAENKKKEKKKTLLVTTKTILKKVEKKKENTQEETQTISKSTEQSKTIKESTKDKKSHTEKSATSTQSSSSSSSSTSTSVLSSEVKEDIPNKEDNTNNTQTDLKQPDDTQNQQVKSKHIIKTKKLIEPSSTAPIVIHHHKDILMSIYQGIVLLSFSNDDVLSFEEIKRRTNLDDLNLRLSLASLCLHPAHFLLHISKEEFDKTCTNIDSSSSSSTSSTSSSHPAEFTDADWLSFPPSTLFILYLPQLFLSHTFRRKNKLRINQHQLKPQKNESQHANENIMQERAQIVCFYYFETIYLSIFFFISLFIYHFYFF